MYLKLSEVAVKMAALKPLIIETSNHTMEMANLLLYKIIGKGLFFS